MLAEGSEEMASDLINWAGDVLVAKDKSQWKLAIQAYMAQGMGEKEAFDTRVIPACSKEPSLCVPT